MPRRSAGHTRRATRQMSMTDIPGSRQDTDGGPEGYDLHDGDGVRSDSRPPPSRWTSGARAARAVARAPLTRRAWAEVTYCLLSFPVAVASVPVLMLLLALGSGLTVTLLGAVLGVLILVGALRLGRALGALHRGLAASLLGERVPPPQPFQPGTGILGRLDARLRDATGWRAVAYCLAKLPVALLGLHALSWWACGLIDLTTPLHWWLPLHSGAGGHRGWDVPTPLPFGGMPHAGTYADTSWAAALGLGMLLVAPWLTRAAIAGDRWLVRALLGPGALAERVRDLEETRALAVNDAATVLRRVERDLHDGAQVRLVAVALVLDMAREKLHGAEATVDAADVRALVDRAHHDAVEALTELRDLARGIHPPVLDEGLPDALATLAARSTVPVDLTVDLPRRPTPAIETIAYFCTAELLANVIKHSGARHAAIEVVEQDDSLRLRVSDDGRGGANPAVGSGLTGLGQRVRTVDGSLQIASPDGGPTVVTVELPLRA